MLLFWKVVDETQMGNPRYHAARDTSSKFSTFLPLRTISKKPYHYETPCMMIFYLSKRIQFTFFALKTNAKPTDLDFANVKLLITMQWQKCELRIDIYVQQYWCSINTAFDINSKLS